MRGCFLGWLHKCKFWKNFKKNTNLDNQDNIDYCAFGVLRPGPFSELLYHNIWSHNIGYVLITTVSSLFSIFFYIFIIQLMLPVGTHTTPHHTVNVKHLSPLSVLIFDNLYTALVLI